MLDREVVISPLRTQTPAIRSSPVFGCHGGGPASSGAERQPSPQEGIVFECTYFLE